MNSSLGQRLFTSLLSVQREVTRFASKKASGGTRNPKPSKGSYKGIKITDGQRAHPQDIIVHKMSPRLWFHPGVNVRLAGKCFNLVARKTGTVRFTCEVPNLNYDHQVVQKFYSGRQGQTFFKKYVHVLPDPQHTRFKCIGTI